MSAIRTVLCSVDFSPATPRQVDVAADLCRAFGARLVLHHNVPGAGVGAAVGWMWTASHPPPETPQAVDDHLRLELARAAQGVTTEARVTEGPIARAVLLVGEAVGADVVVLSTHGTTTDDHTSITEEVLHAGQRAVLALHDEDDSRAPRFAATTGDRQIVLVPTDLTPDSRGAIDVGVELARRLPIDLHLLHLRHGGPASTSTKSDDDLRRQMIALVPADLESRVRLHLEDGNAARGIVEAATDLSASCIIMGEHTRAPLRRWFTRDTSHAVLHRAPCPVWYVPGRRAASLSSDLPSQNSEGRS